MTKLIQQAQLLDRASLVSSPRARSCEDHSFGMPPTLFAAMALLFFGFLAVMTLGFANPYLAVAMAINFIFLTAFFAVPVLFTRLAVGEPSALRCSQFMRRGIETATGHCSGTEAAILTLLLPFVIFLWAVAVILIAALI